MMSIANVVIIIRHTTFTFRMAGARIVRVECADAAVVVITSGHEVQLKLSRKMAAIKKLTRLFEPKKLGRFS